jgi:DNA-binding response OmpR family regulator
MNAADAPIKFRFSNTEEQPTAPRGPGKRILIVDDSVIILKTLSAKLRASGYEVSTAVDGSQAVSTVRQQRPDLILLDISFPPDVGHGGGVSWDGFLILNWLRRMDESLNTPVLIITGTDPAKYKSRCLASGVAGYFQKPINNDELLAAINQLLSPKQEPPQTSSARKILFIDDETDWRFMASVYLNDAGYQVLLAGNGEDAVNQFRENSPDLVLLDLNLVGESGLEVLQRLKATAPTARVVLFTGMDHDPETINQMLRLGAHQYLRKTTMGEMLKVVQTTLAA